MPRPAASSTAWVGQAMTQAGTSQRRQISKRKEIGPAAAMCSRALAKLKPCSLAAEQTTWHHLHPVQSAASRTIVLRSRASHAPNAPPPSPTRPPSAGSPGGKKTNTITRSSSVGVGDAMGHAGRDIERLPGCVSRRPVSPPHLESRRALRGRSTASSHRGALLRGCWCLATKTGVTQAKLTCAPNGGGRQQQPRPAPRPEED